MTETTLASIVVTGVGLVSAAGSSMAELAASLEQGTHCLSPITSFETTGMTATHGGEVPQFDPLDCVPPIRVRTLDRGTLMALAAARQALDAAALGTEVAAETGVAVGVSGATQYQNLFVAPDRQYPVSRQSALYSARSTPDFQAHSLARAYSLGGPRFGFGSASLGGFLALSHAMDLLRAGHAPAMLVGGGEINTLVNALGMATLGMTAVGPCTPFAGSGGICFGDGAAFFVFELRTHAQARGATIIGALAATGISADAYSEVAQDPAGKGLARAVTKCLTNAGSDPAQIGWVRACGTGARDLDAAEAIGLHSVFGDTVPPVTSTEPYFSHVNGVSPLLGLAAVLSGFATGRAPSQPDAGALRPGLGLTALPPGPLPEGDCLLTATAFGGTNGAAIVRRTPSADPVGKPAEDTIVIAGMGAVSTFGAGVAALLHGVQQAAPAGESARRVDDAALKQSIPGVQLNRRERLVRMALIAAAEALGGTPVRGSARYGLLVGLTRGPLSAYERFIDHTMQGRFDVTTGRLLLRTGRFSVASELAHAFGLLGYSGTLATGVHGGVHLLAHGAEILRATPDLDGLLVVAADEWTGLQEKLYRRMNLLGDGVASGCVGGEGAAALLLCRRQRAGATPGDAAVFAGAGFAGDTSLRPDPAGDAYQRAIRAALVRAGAACAPFTIGQACGWVSHDTRERAAVREACPETNLLSVLRHTGVAEAAGGLFGAIAAVDALRHTPHGLLVGSTERGAHAAVVLSQVAE